MARLAEPTKGILAAAGNIEMDGFLDSFTACTGFLFWGYALTCGSSNASIPIGNGYTVAGFAAPLSTTGCGFVFMEALQPLSLSTLGASFGNFGSLLWCGRTPKVN
jgi:hypothetical protein